MVGANSSLFNYTNKPRKDKPMHALIDGDIILYSVGFASEDRQYDVVEEATGKVVTSFQYASDAKYYMSDKEGLVKVLDRQPVKPHVWKGNANKLLDRITDNTNSDTYTVYLTGKGNFRETLTDNYKENRKDADKPLMFKEFKQWLIDTHGAVVIEGREADDELATQGYLSEDSVICTLDKDLKMVPGNHYNWTRNESTKVTPATGDKWFFKQLLMGDPTDNIIGLKGIGPKTADKLIDPLDSTEEMLKVCQEQYELKEISEDMLVLNGHLLWMQRTGPECKWTDWFNYKGKEQTGETQT